MAQIYWKRVVGVFFGGMLLTTVLLFCGCATQSFIQKQLGPITETTAETSRRLVGLEQRQAQQEKVIAEGFGLVGEGLNALTNKNKELGDEVAELKDSNNTQLGELRKSVATAKAEARAARRSVAKARDELREEVRGAAVRVQGELVTLHEGQEFYDDEARGHMSNEADKTRQHVTADGNISRQVTTNVRMQSQRILEELEKLKSSGTTSSPAPVAPSAPPAATSSHPPGSPF